MRSRLLAAALGALCASSACGQRGSASPQGNGGASSDLAPVVAGAAAGGATSALATTPAAAGDSPVVTQQLTPGSLALGNLSDRIQALEQRLERQGSLLFVRAQLVDTLLARTQFSSTFSDFERAEELAEKAPERFPRVADALLLRARFRAAVHRFDAAEADLQSAEALGARTQATELQRASLHIAQGHELESALHVAERRAKSLPTLERFSLQALAEAALGRFDAADEHYRTALASYRDVSPFPVAAIEFQRGMMWAELAHAPERALPHYRESVRVLPEYVVANVHLAELELSRGESAAAEQRFRQVAGVAEDPEPWARLGQLLIARSPGDAEGRALIERARGRYELLLSRQRAAFSDHAAEFFMGPGGSPAQALELARENLQLRQTGRAYELALQSAQASGDTQLFCQYASQAGQAATRSRNLAALLASNSARCNAAISARP